MNKKIERTMDKNNWTYKKLGEVCDFQGGSQPPKNEWSKEPKIGYVRMLQIRDFTQNATDYIEYVKESKSLKYCNEDDILIGRYGASVGKILSGLSGAYNVAIIKTIPRDIVNKNYIKYYFLSPYFQHNLLIVSQHRAAQAGFSKDDIVDFQIPCPPLAEQERIVAELDLLSSIIDKKKAQLKELDQLAQSIFYDMFGDPITNEKGWEVKKFEEVCSSMTKGPFGSDIKKSLYVPKSKDTYKVYIQINAIEKDATLGTYYISKEYFDNKMFRFEVKPNDYIITCDGTLGKFLRLPQSIEKGIISASLLRITLNEKINYKYFEHIWDCYILQQQTKDIRNTALKHLPSASKIGKTLIPLPPLPLQQEFAEKVESIEQQKSLIQQSIDEVQTLFDSRMDYWFG